jgi:tripartite-type tricarboxylate transporter receptor subunit TctC
VAVTWAPSLRAANYPDHSVKIIVLFPPGGSTDIAGRIVAQKLSERFVASFGN